MQLNNPSLSLTSLPGPGVPLQTPESREKALKGHVEEFASLLYAQMVREMREASKPDDQEEGGGGLLGGGDTDAFMLLFDQQLGKNFASQGGAGLKEALFHQLSSALPAPTEAKGGSQ